MPSRRSIPGYHGYYEASRDGVIWSLRHRHGKRRAAKPLKGLDRGYGYESVGLHKHGRMKHYQVHRLVLSAFVGPCPHGHECRHLNGQKRDNRLVNLVWGTRSENTKDQIRHGTFNYPVQYRYQKAG